MSINTAIKTNILAINSHRNLRAVANEKAIASMRLSSGFRINSAADDAAGLGIVTKMRAQIRGIDQASRNAQDAISLIQTAEGGIATINEMLIRMRELVIKAANDTNVHENMSLSQSDRVRIQDEINHLIAEIDAVSKRIQFNTRTLLSGNYERPDAEAIAPFTATMAFASYVAGIEPFSTPPLNPTMINFNNLVDGDSGVGWEYTGGVLRITGNGDFQINGNGTVAGDRRIEVQNGVTAGVILNNVNINTSSGSALNMYGATVNLWLDNNNVLNASNAVNSAGIRTSFGSLTINGTGTLAATGSVMGGSQLGGAGIGGVMSVYGLVDNSGDITILGGNIIAIGGNNGAGIGSGNSGSTGNITITGGNITATGGTGGGAGIGSGAGGGGFNATITITGGNITATGGNLGSGIGGGVDGHVENIIISGGNTVATGGGGGAGIGNPQFGGHITINEGIVIATGGYGSAAIGGGSGSGGGISGNGVALTINGGLVEIGGAGQWIGGCHWGLLSGSTTINGGNLSISNPNNIHNTPTHNNQPAFRVQITLQNEDGSTEGFGNHTAVTYTIGGITINAITDSQGRLFMYLPADFEGEGVMEFNGQTFRYDLIMTDNHDNQLILRISGEEGPPDNGQPDNNNQRPPSTTQPPHRTNALHFQIGPNSGHSLFLHIGAMDAETLGLRNGDDILINVLETSGYYLSPLLKILDIALSYATRERSNLGAMQNRLEFTIENLNIASENLSSSESRIKDADMAMEMKRLAKANILQQAAMTMLAQANQAMENVLHLLR